MEDCTPAHILDTSWCIEIYVKPNLGKQEPYLRCERQTDKIRFNVTLPESSTGVDERLTITNEWKATLTKRRDDCCGPFLFSIKQTRNLRKDCVKNEILLACKESSKKCNVKLLKCKVSDISSLQFCCNALTIDRAITTNAELAICVEESIRVQKSIRSPAISLRSKNVVVASEAIIRTNVFESSANKTTIDGAVSYINNQFPKKHREKHGHSLATKQTKGLQSEVQDKSESHLKIRIGGDLHVGTDGKIGFEDLKKLLVEFISLSVSGDICNFGEIRAYLKIELTGKNFLSGKKCKVDTAQRFHNCIKEKLGVENNPEHFEILPTTDNLKLAVKEYNADAVAELLQRGADPQSPLTSKGKTVSDIASKNLTDNFRPADETFYSRNREKPDAVFSLIRSWKKRSGIMKAQEIFCNLDGNLDDCSQLFGLYVHFNVKGDITVEENTIWSSGNISGRCMGNFTVEGDAKLTKFVDFNVGNIFLLEHTGRMFISKGGEIKVCDLFHIKNVMYSCKSNEDIMLHITTNTFKQSSDSILGSRCKLRLSILDHSIDWKGKIEANVICFDIGGECNLDGKVLARDICAIKILVGTQKKLGTFHILKNGSVEVEKGIFFADKGKDKQSDDFDIHISGKMIAKGIHADNISMNLLGNSETKVLSDATDGGEIVNCLVHVLQTNKRSKMLFCVTSKQSELRCKIGKWIHRGIMAINKPDNFKTKVTLEVSEMKNCGVIETSDVLQLTIHQHLINTRLLEAKNGIYITGNGILILTNKCVLKCRDGPVEMRGIGRLHISAGSEILASDIVISTILAKKCDMATFDWKWDIKNSGKIQSYRNVTIEALNLFNRNGLIISKHTFVDITWNAPFPSCIEGIVYAPEKINFISKHSETFRFQCSGGKCVHNEDRLEHFIVPEKGVDVECTKGIVVIATEIVGDSPSYLKLSSYEGCLILDNIQVPNVQFQLRHEKHQDASEEKEDINICKEESKHSSQVRITYDSISNEYIFKDIQELGTGKSMDNSVYYIRLLKQCYLKTQRFILKNEKLSKARIKTYENSKVYATYIGAKNTLLTLDGTFDFFGFGAIDANALTISKHAYCVIYPKLGHQESRLHIHGTTLLSVEGQLRQRNKNECISSSPIYMSGRNIQVSGCINTGGVIDIAAEDGVWIMNGGKISCTGLSCPPYASKSNSGSTFRITSGILSVCGPVECKVKSFTMDKDSKMHLTSGKHVYIESMSSATFSGKFHCYTGDQIILRSHEDLSLIDLEFVISDVCNTLIEGNITILDKNSRLEITNQTETNGIKIKGSEYLSIAGNLFQIEKGDSQNPLYMFGKNLNVTGLVDTSRKLILNVTEKVCITNDGMISCTGLIGTGQEISTCSFNITGGSLSVCGDVECEVESFSLDNNSEMWFTSGNHFYIDSISTVTISGKFHCGKGKQLILHSHGALHLRDLNCLISDIGETVIVGNITTLGENSVLEINSAEQETSRVHFEGKDCLYVEGRLSIDGEIKNELSTENHISPIHMSGRKIQVSGTINTGGIIVLKPEKEVSIKIGGKVSCTGLFCKPNAQEISTCDFSITGGILSVNGTAECKVQSFSLHKGSEMYFTNGSNFYIDSISTVTLSGKFHCGKGKKMILQSHGALHLRDLNCQIFDIGETVIVGNKTTLGENSVLEINSAEKVTSRVHFEGKDYLYVEGRLSIDGEIKKELSTENHILPIHMSGRKIQVSGTIKTGGIIVLKPEKEVSIKIGGKVSCTGLFCKPNAQEISTCDFSITGGILSVNGTAECKVQSFSLHKGSEMYFTNGSNFYIDSISTVTLSGKFHCGKGKKMILQSHGALHLRDLNCLISEIGHTVIVGNITTLGENSVLEINSAEQVTSRVHFEGKDCLYVEGRLSIDGEIKNELSTENHILPIHMSGRKIQVSGTIKTGGIIVLKPEKEVSIKIGGKVSCTGLFCKPNAQEISTCDFSITGGILCVNGTAECKVQSFSLHKGSEMYFTNGSNFYIDSISTVTLSGKFHCGKGKQLILHSHGALHLRDLNCLISEIGDTVIVGNITTLGENSVLEINSAEKETSRVHFEGKDYLYVEGHLLEKHRDDNSPPIYFFGRNLHVSGCINTRRIIFLDVLKEINIVDSGIISCGGLSCLPDASQSITEMFNIAGGSLTVNGPVKCNVQSFISDNAAICFSSGAHFIINTTASLILSGSFICKEGKRLTLLTGGVLKCTDLKGIISKVDEIIIAGNETIIDKTSIMDLSDAASDSSDLRIEGSKCLTIDGKIKKQLSIENHISPIHMSGRKIQVSGTINTGGIIILKPEKEVSIKIGGEVSCTGLSCTPNAQDISTCDFSITGGILSVNGTAECKVQSFSLHKGSEMYFTNGSHFYIDSMHSITFSGTLQCRKGKQIIFQAQDELNLKNLKCLISDVDYTMIVGNTTYLDEDVVLEINFGKHQTEIKGIDSLSIAGSILKKQTDYPPPLCFFGKELHVSGIVDTRGVIVLYVEKEVCITDGGTISCTGLFCQPHASQITQVFSISGGNLTVNGVLQCKVQSFTTNNKSKMDFSSGDHFVIDTTSSLTLSGKLNCCGGNFLEIQSSGDLHFNDLHCVSNVGVNNITGKVISINKDSVINTKQGRLLIETLNKDNQDLTGDISLSGRIYSSVGDGGKTILEIQCKDLFISGANIEGFDLVAAYVDSLNVSLDSNVHNIYEMVVDATTIDVQGKFIYIERLDLKPDNLLIRGLIHVIDQLTIVAKSTVVNCGTVQTKYTGVVAPIFFNCPVGPICNEQFGFVPTLGDGEQEEIVVEGLLCIAVGSVLQSRNITVKSVLRFDFVSKQSTSLPTQRELDSWKRVVNSSLLDVARNSTSDNERIVKEALEIPKVVCKLGVGSLLCQDIVQLSQAIIKDGLAAFRIEDLVQCLNKAHTQYTNISTLQLLKEIPKKIRKLKNAGKAVATELMEKIFGSLSFSSTLEFKRANPSVDEGIESNCFVFEGEKTDVKTSGSFSATSLNLGGDRGIWKNEGDLETCGDIIVVAKFVEQSGRLQKRMKSVYGCIAIEADKVTAENLQSKNLRVNAEKQVTINTANVENKTAVQGESIKVKDINSGSMEASASNKVQIDNAHVQESSSISSGGSIQINNLSSDIVDIEATGNVDIGDLKSNNDINVLSTEGDVTLNSKVKGQTAHLDARKGKISLKGQCGEAKHELKKLDMRTMKFEDFEKMLKKTGAYRDLKVAEEFDLAVDDQDVILANINMDAALKLKAKSIDVQYDIKSKKDIGLQASEGQITVRKRARVRAKDNVIMISHTKLDVCEGAYVEAGKDVYMESETSSVNMKAATVTADGKVGIKAKQDINVSAKDNEDGAATKSLIHAGKSSDGSASITLAADRDISVHASDIKSDGENQFLAKRNINFTAHIYKTSKTETESSWLGLKQKVTTTTTTHVDKSQVYGETNTFKAGGEFQSIASNFCSELGNTVHAKGKVSFKDIVTEDETNTTTKVLGGLLYHRNENATSEVSYGSLVEDTSSLANTKIISDTSDIEWTGSSIKSSGHVLEKAKSGKVVHQKQVLTQNKSVNKYGVYVGRSFNNSKDVIPLKVGLGFHHSAQRNQTLSDDSLECRSYSVEAEEFKALNAFDIKVVEDMTLDVRKFDFEGAQLKSSGNTFGLGLEVDKTTVQVSAGYSRTECMTNHHGNVNVGGKLSLVNVEKGVFDCSDADVGDIVGDVGKLNVISRADTKNKFQFGVDLGVELVTRTPELGLSVGREYSENVNSSTSLNVRNSSHGLTVENLDLKGATISFDGDVHNFAKNIITEDVQEVENNFNLNLTVKNPTKITKPSAILGFGFNRKQGRTTSCIASSSGKIDKSMKQRVNTDISKCKVVDLAFGLSFTHEFKGNVVKNLQTLSKNILKSVGKEVTIKSLNKVSTELGISTDITQVIMGIADGKISIESALKNVLVEAGKSVLPKELIDALETFVAEGNPMKLVLWICDKIGIKSDLMDIFVGIINGSTKPERFVMELVHFAAKQFGLPDEVASIADGLTKWGGPRGSLKVNKKVSSLSVLKSQEGQNIFRRLSSFIGIPSGFVDLILAVINQSNPLQMFMFICKLFADAVGISSIVISLVESIILDGNVKEAVTLAAKEVTNDANIIKIIA